MKIIFEDKKAQLHFVTLILLFAIASIIIVTAANSTTEENIDLCQSVVCEQTEIVCPDGTISICSNSCNPASGICSSCTPSCVGHENQPLEPVSEEDVEASANETSSDTSEVISFNESSQTVISNRTSNENETNQTSLNESNESQEVVEFPIEENPEVVVENKPVFSVEINHKEKVTRGEEIEVSASILNFGSTAKKVEYGWILPNEFEIISGEELGSCGNIGEGESCEFSIFVSSSIESSLGLNQIKLGVGYNA